MEGKIIDHIEFSLIKGVGSRRIKQIYEVFGDLGVPLENPELLVDTFGEGLYLAVKNRPSDLRKRAEEEYRKARQVGAEVVVLGDGRYPSLLKEIPDPPPYLYVKGKLPRRFSSLSVVGSRKFSGYGENITKKVVDLLVENGITVVSGLASGIDSIAHSRCVEKGGFTVAVLGSGIDQVFPPENRKLYRLIEENGCILSEFPVGTKASRYTFPQRNRVIAGLSYGTVITEAGEKSGALITARYSNEYGRVVFSVPTNINNPYGRGSNLLLKEGAVPLVSPEDIFEHLPYLKGKGKREERITELDGVQERIISLLNAPIHVDLLAEKVGMPVSELTVVLFQMEMEELLSVKDGIVYRV
ncbi:MAG: DNA-protecting protein DprA [Aquificae bacterium]|nr:DNA-protecting protein DprA [Aquificota bacterium]